MGFSSMHAFFLLLTNREIRQCIEFIRCGQYAHQVALHTHL